MNLAFDRSRIRNEILYVEAVAALSMPPLAWYVTAGFDPQAMSVPGTIGLIVFGVLFAFWFVVTPRE